MHPPIMAPLMTASALKIYLDCGRSSWPLEIAVVQSRPRLQRIGLPPVTPMREPER